MILGVGIKDIPTEAGCPFYSRWRSMITRCYSEKFLSKNKSYLGCKVCDSWLNFSNFKSWMSIQNWDGNCLDKDIIYYGNKLYSPEVCAFIPTYINTVLGDCSSKRGELPIGVCYRKKDGKMVKERTKPYLSVCQDNNGRQKHLGCYETPEKAHIQWQKQKIVVLESVIARYQKSDYPDQRVIGGLEYRAFLLKKDLSTGKITAGL